MTKYIVTGPVVVLPTEDGSERYLYNGAHIDGGFTEAGIKHALGLGLIGKAPKDEKPSTPAETETPEPYKGVSVPDLKVDLEKRNEGREDADKIVPAEPGNRPEIVAALVADDNKQS